MSFRHGFSWILLPAIVIVTTRLAVSKPDHGEPLFLGYSYWTQRYPSLGYTSDWDGFWNNYDRGRKQYERTSSETTGVACGGCVCDDVTEELQCGVSPTTL